MRIIPAVIFSFLCFFSFQFSKAQDSAVRQAPRQDISWQDTLARESSSFRDSINAIRDSDKAMQDSIAIIRDSVHRSQDAVMNDSLKMHWLGWAKYKVEPRHAYAINSKNVLKGKKKAELQYNIADFYLYLNGQLIKPPKSGSPFFAAGCLCFKYDDTLLLNSGLGFRVGVGIKIMQGRFTSSLHANTHNTEVYKKSKNESTYIKNIIAEPETQLLRLYSEPSNNPNEIIIGEYQASYKKFYQKNEDDQDEVRKYFVRIIFRCRLSGGIDSFKSDSGSGSK